MVERRLHVTLVSIAIAAGSLMLAPRTASAFGTPHCTVGQTIPVPIDLTYNSTTHWIVPEDLNSVALNANNTYDFHDINATPAVTGLSFHFSSFQTEVKNDRLEFGLFPTPIIFSGPMGAFDTPPMTNSGSAAGDPWLVDLNYVTDKANPSQGFTIDSATITSCATAPIPVQNIYDVAERRVIGILTGTDDTLYYSYPPPKVVPPGIQLGPQSLHIALTTAPSLTNTNFDIYLSCGSVPTASSYMVAGVSPGSQEFIDVLLLTQCLSRWYIAVNSAQGAGAFELNVVYGADQPVCVRFENGSFTKAQEDSLRNQVLKSVGGVFGSTGGVVLMTPIQFINDVNADCDNSIISNPGATNGFRHVNLKASCGRSSTASQEDYGNAHSDLCTDYTLSGGTIGAHRILAHEMGHLFWSLPDEYNDAHGAQCGHSMMSTADATYYSLCTQWNHTLDPVMGADAYHDPGQPVSAPPFGDNQSMWNKLVFDQYGPPYTDQVQQADTAENYDYLDFNFNASSTVIDVHNNYQ